MLDLNPASLVARIVVLIVAFTIHELAHAVVADRLGDPTARRMGRLTLNPVAHIDPIGGLMLLVTGFGWAKPVQVNPFNLRGDPRTSMALIAAAGPLSNVALALLGVVPLRLALIASRGLEPSFFQSFWLEFCFLNLGLALFNILPIPPLDGFKLLLGGLPERTAESLRPMEQFGFLILIAIVFAAPDFTRLLVWQPAVSILSLLLGDAGTVWLTF